MSSPIAPGSIAPDTNDWTWVLERPCPDCGFDASAHALADLPTLLHDTAMVWSQVLRGAGVAVRPEAGTWSPLEYACHVRDVHLLFATRVRTMVEQDGITWADWDQDQAADAGCYAEQEPAHVDVELIEAAGDVAGLYASITDEMRERRGRRADGMVFTFETLGRYHLHDVVHHLHDVDWSPGAATVKAYDAFARQYADATATMPDSLRHLVQDFVAALPAGARVLEIGSGSGRDALLLEQLSVHVRRTDVSLGFVAMLREQGFDAEVLDPLHDDLSSPEGGYDAVWASACLLHVERADLPTVLARLAEVSLEGALLHLGVKEGDGESWSTHGSIAAPRRFVYWREEPLRMALTDSGWDVDAVTRGTGLHGESWLQIRARRMGPA